MKIKLTLYFYVFLTQITFIYLTSKLHQVVLQSTTSHIYSPSYRIFDFRDHMTLSIGLLGSCAMCSLQVVYQRFGDKMLFPCCSGYFLMLHPVHDTVQKWYILTKLKVCLQSLFSQRVLQPLHSPFNDGMHGVLVCVMFFSVPSTSSTVKPNACVQQQFFHPECYSVTTLYFGIAQFSV